GHELFYCAGELGGYAKRGTLIPLLHFSHHTIKQLNQRVFGDSTSSNIGDLHKEINIVASEIQDSLLQFVRSNRLKLLIVQNALSIPMNLPLGVCLAGLISDLKINTIAHHHDFFWERERYQSNPLLDLLDTTFPPDLPYIQHVTINSIAQKRLRLRRKIKSTVIPNVHDFATSPKGTDPYNRDFRSAIGLKEIDIFILQPTRVIRRKGIEMAIELVKRLELTTPSLIISHSATDEGISYLEWLKWEANQIGIDLKVIDKLVDVERYFVNGHKVYSLWDVYPHADLVTYPSIYEGFGNALLESIYFKRMVVVNRYPVYNADIKPLGINMIELDGYVDDRSVHEVRNFLDNPERFENILEENYNIARKHFSLETLEKRLEKLLANFDYE
ncbi:MAG: glycosyltransferase family 4 protein, partial [Anaerolineales bacterium]